MHLLSLELIQSRDLRKLRRIELTNSRDQEVRCDGVIFMTFRLFTPQHFHGGLPLLLGIIPVCLFNGSVESNVLEEIVLLGDADEVVLDICELGGQDDWFAFIEMS